MQTNGCIFKVKDVGAGVEPRISLSLRCGCVPCVARKQGALSIRPPHRRLLAFFGSSGPIACRHGAHGINYRRFRIKARPGRRSDLTCPVPALPQPQAVASLKIGFFWVLWKTSDEHFRGGDAAPASPQCGRKRTIRLQRIGEKTRELAGFASLSHARAHSMLISGFLFVPASGPPLVGGTLYTNVSSRTNFQSLVMCQLHLTVL